MLNSNRKSKEMERKMKNGEEMDEKMERKGGGHSKGKWKWQSKGKWIRGGNVKENGEEKVVT